MGNLKFCADCGAKLEENTKFCGSCGAKVESAPQPENNSAEQAVQSVQASAPVQNTESAVPPQQNQNPQPQVNQNINPQQQTNAEPNYNPQPNNGFANQAPQNNQQFNSAPAAATSNVGTVVKEKKNLIIAITAITAVLIVALIVILNITKYQKIDAQELFRVNFVGLNGKGTAAYTLNRDPNSSDYISNFSDYLDIDLDDYDLDIDDDDEQEDKYSNYLSSDKKVLEKTFNKAKDADEAVQMRKALTKKNSKGEYKLKLEFSADKNLTNGDKITCTVNYDEESLKKSKIKLKNTTFDVEVKDLKEGTAIDITKAFKVEFKGSDGSGTAELTTSEDYPFIKSDISKSYNLSNGDKVTVTSFVRNVDNLIYINGENENDGICFDYEDKTYILEKQTISTELTVTGLKELEEIDVFEGIEFVTDGVMPYLKVTGVDSSACSSEVQNNVTFTVENRNQYLNVGDKVTITARIDSGFATAGYKAKDIQAGDNAVRKEFTIGDNYSKYLVNDATYEDVSKLDEAFNTEVEKFKTKYTGSKNIITKNSFSLDGKIKKFKSFDEVGRYITVYDGLQDGTGGTFSKKNHCIRIYKVVVEIDNDDKKEQTFYISIAAHSVYINPDETAVNDGFEIISAKEKKEIVAEYESISDSKTYELKSADAKEDDSSSKEDTSSKSDDSSKKEDSNEKSDESSKKSDESSQKSDSADKKDTSSEEIVP